MSGRYPASVDTNQINIKLTLQIQKKNENFSIRIPIEKITSDIFAFF